MVIEYVMLLITIEYKWWYNFCDETPSFRNVLNASKCSQCFCTVSHACQDVSIHAPDSANQSQGHNDFDWSYIMLLGVKIDWLIHRILTLYRRITQYNRVEPVKKEWKHISTERSFLKDFSENVWKNVPWILVVNHKRMTIWLL